MCGIPTKPILVYLQTEMDTLKSNRWDLQTTVPFSLLVFDGDLITAKSLFFWFSSFLQIGFELCYWVATILQVFFHISFPSHWLLTAVPTCVYFIQVLHFTWGPIQGRCWGKSMQLLVFLCSVHCIPSPTLECAAAPRIAHPMRPFQISQDSVNSLVNSQSSPDLLWVHSRRTQTDMGAENP